MRTVRLECALGDIHGPEFHVLEGPNAGRFKSAGRRTGR